MATVRENLIAAKALIDTPEKWGKGDFTPAPGCFCTFGAIAAINGFRFGVDKYPPTYAEDMAIARCLPEGWAARVDVVPDFNDDPSTTHADIMALFDRAIAAQAA